MKITVTWFGDQFNVSLASAEGKAPFIDIKGCRIVSGPTGEFVSWPATKNQSTGKYWRHVYSSEPFGVAVLDEARKMQKNADTRTHAERKRPAPVDDDSEIPF